MAGKKRIYPNPEFKSAEEEDAYWAGHSALDEGYEGEVQSERQKRSSFLTLRLTGEELTQLRDLAAGEGMGPSTYIRSVLKRVIGEREMMKNLLNKSKKMQGILARDANRVVKSPGGGSGESTCADVMINNPYFIFETGDKAALQRQLIYMLAQTLAPEFDVHPFPGQAKKSADTAAAAGRSNKAEAKRPAARR